MSSKNRREFLQQGLSAAAMLSLPSLLNAQPAGTNGNAQRKIVCVGGHPDDPESGCGGTLAKLAKAGHSITIIYLTTGEAGIPGKSHAEAAAIRKQEAISACKILNAKPVFAGQVDGNTMVNNEWLNKLQALINNESPDIVFTHWPVDSHKDHQCAGLLTIQTWVRAEKKFLLYFFEVCTGEQSLIFHPTDYVDISDTQEQKKKAIYCHTSQDPPGIYNCGHADMEIFRGRELGVKAAEGFVKMNGSSQGGFSI